MLIIGLSVIISIDLYTMLIKNEHRDTIVYKDAVEIVNIHITDEFGFNLKEIKKGNLILIQSEILNLENKTQDLVHIIKVQGEDNTVYALLYNKSTLLENDKIIVANSWRPTNEGVYYIYIYIWGDNDGKEVLTSKKGMMIKVY